MTTQKAWLLGIMTGMCMTASILTTGWAWVIWFALTLVCLFTWLRMNDLINSHGLRPGRIFKRK